jgi:hypothetical protein
LTLTVNVAAAAPLLVMTPPLEPVGLLTSSVRPLRSSVAVVVDVPTVNPPVRLLNMATAELLPTTTVPPSMAPELPGLVRKVPVSAIVPVSVEEP